MISRWYKTDRQLNSLVEPGDDQSVVQKRQTAHSLVEPGDDQSVVGAVAWNHHHQHCPEGHVNPVMTLQAQRTVHEPVSPVSAADHHHQHQSRSTISVFVYQLSFPACLQCFDTVGWAAGRASGLTES